MLYVNAEGSAYRRTTDSRRAERFLSLGYIPVDEEAANAAAKEPETNAAAEEKPKRGKKPVTNERVIEA